MKSFLVFLLVMASSQATLAQKNGNASLGTKELLARIEALESAVAAIGGSNDVRGNAYLVIGGTNHLWATNEGPASGASIIATRSLYVFRQDGNVDITSLLCEGRRLHDEDWHTNPGYLESVPFCQPADSTITVPYNQTEGGESVVIDLGWTQLALAVSDDGSVLLNNGFNSNPAAPCAIGDCTIDSASMVSWTGIRVGAAD